ncbi:MAG: Wzz/FepE/Etk N-terminal domain-containing protein [bacterium]|nr:Wzz/FepE/Etk N-terminal domain-containing protein [bacterium]
MEFKDYLTLISKRKGIMASFVFAFVILAIILSLLQPFKYGSSSQVLVIQNSSNPDPYLASKSTEYLSNILAKVISSNSFYENVLDSGYYVNKNYFGQTVKDQMKIWAKTISTKAINDSGIISLNIYHADRSQAELINRAVVFTLQTKHGLYHGGGENVSIKVIDEPITSNYPVKPDLILNFGLALVLGLVFSLIYIYLFPEEKYNLRLIPKSTGRKAGPDSLEEPQFAPDAFEPVAATAEEVFTESENNFSENLPDNNFDDYDDLDIREEIAKQGSMKNIFGKPYSDNQ